MEARIPRYGPLGYKRSSRYNNVRYTPVTQIISIDISVRFCFKMRSHYGHIQNKTGNHLRKYQYLQNTRNTVSIHERQLGARGASSQTRLRFYKLRYTCFLYKLILKVFRLSYGTKGLTINSICLNRSIVLKEGYNILIAGRCGNIGNTIEIIECSLKVHE